MTFRTLKINLKALCYFVLFTTTYSRIFTSWTVRFRYRASNNRCIKNILHLCAVPTSQIILSIRRTGQRCLAKLNFVDKIVLDGFFEPLSIPIFLCDIAQGSANFQCFTMHKWWRGEDSNLRRLSQQIYSLPPLAAREPLRKKSNARLSINCVATSIIYNNQSCSLYILL